MGHGLYLYGIFPPPGPQRLTGHGLDNQPLHTHPINDFVFLYSEAQQERYLASRRNLLGHAKVLEQAMEAGYRTVLPLQFGLIIENWQTVQTQLVTPHHDKLIALLDTLNGQREVGVKVFWEPSEELEAMLEENQPLRDQRDSLEGKQLSLDQVVAIGQAIERAMADRKESTIEIFQTTLNPLAKAVVENDLLTDNMIYNAAYLIPWDDEPLFSDRVEQLDQQFANRLRIRYNNLTAPYNFAQLE